MPSLQDQLKKVTEQLGIPTTVSETSPPAESFGRNPIRQTRTIKFDKDSRYNRKATAPYNFVPLNEKIITGERYDGFDAFGKDERQTGYILCDIECLTPIYIRDAISEEENKREVKSRAIPSFFSPAGQIRIPGSSLRGMTRTLVEILSWSKITTDRKRFFYYRGLADKSNLRNAYQSLMSSFDQRTKKSTYKMSAGYLKKVGTQYQIIPAQVINGKQFYQIDKKETKSAFPMESECESYYYKSGDSFIVISGFMPNKKHDWVVNPPNTKSGALEILEIDIRNYNLDENRSEPQPTCNILTMASEKKGELIPCFYVEWRDEQKHRRVAFGHTAFFRLAYKQSVGDLLPSGFNVFDRNHPDIAEAIFGMVPEPAADAKKEQRPIAGRVFFEDADLVSPPEKSEAPIGISQILSSPKPTTFQHYLVQTSDFIKELQHYNSDDTLIRGYKQFWNQAKDWQAREIFLKRKEFADFIGKRGLEIPNEFKEDRDEKTIIHNFPDLKDEKLRRAIIEFLQGDENSQYSIITPLRATSRFIAKIRFENLTEVELGALLFALDLPPGCCHKIGMGKPIGLGSVKITPQLFLSDRAQRYSSLSYEWTEEKNPESNESFNQLKNAFAQHILGKLDAAERPDTNQLWDSYRLKQLQTMLDWSHTAANNWNNLTRYLEIEHPQNENEYKNRPVLPLPEDVVKFKI